MPKSKTGPWLIQLGREAAPLARYLAQSAEGPAFWAGEAEAALRFGSKAEAERFARGHVAGAVFAARAW